MSRDFSATLFYGLAFDVRAEPEAATVRRYDPRTGAPYEAATEALRVHLVPRTGDGTAGPFELPAAGRPTRLDWDEDNDSFSTWEEAEAERRIADVLRAVGFVPAAECGPGIGPDPGVFFYSCRALVVGQQLGAGGSRDASPVRVLAPQPHPAGPGAHVLLARLADALGDGVRMLSPRLVLGLSA